MKKKTMMGLFLLALMVMLAASACGQPEAESMEQENLEQESPAPDSTPNGIQETEQEPAETTEKTASDAREESGEPTKKEVSPQPKENSVQAEETGQKTTLPLENPEKKNMVTLQVTRDFGSQVILNKKVELQEGGTVLDILEANLEVETDLDGGFIKGINGLKMDKGGLSGKRTDWFYYVNGICADAGADGYSLREGETIWWDYHLWESMGSAISAVIGSYPEPFMHGYGEEVGGTTVMSTPEKTEPAEKMKKALTAKGVKIVNLSVMDEKILKKRKGPVIVVGEWQELNQVKWLQDFNKAYRKTGTGAHFTDQGVELIKYNGEMDREVSGSVGVMMATGSGLGDETPLWLVVGTDEKGLEQAVNLLADHPEKISGMYGAAVVSGDIIRLPIQ